jgi:hypothetical protein
MLIAIKKIILKYVPGAHKLRNFKNKILGLYAAESRLQHLEKYVLARQTAQLLQSLYPMTSPQIQLVRIGNEGDGGYIMANCFEKIDAAYSFGIANDVSWDSAIANKSIPVYMYDHTIQQLPAQHELFHFFRVGICGKPNISGMKDIAQIMKENGHLGKNLILKMDIEGFEWPALDALNDEELACFSQIVCEIHDLNNLLFDTYRHEIISRNLKKILKHMHCVHIHANNVGWVAESDGVRIPVLLELTFVKKSLATDFSKTDALRDDLDRESDPTKQKIDISNLWHQE